MGSSVRGGTLRFAYDPKTGKDLANRTISAHEKTTRIDRPAFTEDIVLRVVAVLGPN